MNSLNIANFLFSRIEQTIANKKYIEAVDIKYSVEETYGNHYINIYYEVALNDCFFNELSLVEQNSLFLGSPHYTFSLSTHAESRRDQGREIQRIIEFKYIYESLTAYVLLQLQKNLPPETPIKIKGTDLLPEVSYAEKHLNILLYERYENTMSSVYRQDISQWVYLHELAKTSKKRYVEDKNSFSITDEVINKISGLRLDKIRSILLCYQVPINIKGVKTIDKIYIHTPSLVSALKETYNDYYSDGNKFIYLYLIIFLYDNYLIYEKARINDKQQSHFLNQFIIQKGDIAQLNDLRIVIVNDISIDEKNMINIEYTIMKTNLEPSQRRRAVSVENIMYVLKKDDFWEYKKLTSLKHISLLEGWMLKRKKKINPEPFELDLTK